MTQPSPLTKSRAILLGAVAILALSGAAIASYGGPPAHAESAAAAPALPAVAVSAQTITAQNVRVWSAFSARLQAVDYAEIRPEVSGRIQDIRFMDGQTVKAGEVLFVIDPAPYEAAVAKAEAHLASAVTSARFAKTDLDRATSLVKTQTIPERIFDERGNTSRVAQASVLVAQAELKQARIDLGHAYVKAPISGRVSRAEITLGNLVQAGPAAPLLTAIVSNNGIYADFEVDEQTYLKSFHARADAPDKEKQIPVELTVQGDESHPYKGNLYSFDNKINTASGTIRARARFGNEDGRLVPGMFVSVKLGGSTDGKALLVSERAIGNDQSKKFVYVVGDADKVVYREVKLGPQVDGQRIVLAGLQAGDRVITDGLQHIRPDITVLIKNASNDQLTGTPANSAAN